MAFRTKKLESVVKEERLDTSTVLWWPSTLTINFYDRLTVSSLCSIVTLYYLQYKLWRLRVKALFDFYSFCYFNQVAGNNAGPVFRIRHCWRLGVPIFFVYFCIITWPELASLIHFGYFVTQSVNIFFENNTECGS